MDAQLRTLVTESYVDHASACVGTPVPLTETAAQFIAVAKRMTVPAFEAEKGWRCDPPLPGLLEKPEKMKDGWRMICATRFHVAGQLAGVLFMTLMSGRTVSAFVGGPDTVIPKEYLPADSR